MLDQQGYLLQWLFHLPSEFQYYLLLKRHHIKNAEKKMTDSLKMVGLDSSYLYKSPYEISLSEQKKVSLALVLSFNPKIIVLDDYF